MSSINELDIMEQIYNDLCEQDHNGLLNHDIEEHARENNLHADDDRDQIIQELAEERFLNLYN